MKKWLLLSLLFGILALALSGYNPPEALAQTQLQQGGITMLPSTIPVSPDLQARVLELLAEDAPIRGVFVYAITNVNSQSGYTTVSVAGLPMNSTEMRLVDAVWLGNVMVPTTGSNTGIVDTIANGQPTTNQQAGTTESPRGGAQSILPFRSGTTATYGTRAVHDCGFSLNGWKAVDLIPTEDMVYASQAGQVAYVCRDDTQIALRIGENLYTHLVDGGQQVGDQYGQGQQIAGMVTGSFDKPCGWADQGENNFHVHFCFVPNSGQGWSADGYVLNISTQNWYKGEEVVQPGGTLTADWSNANITPGYSTVGGNFFDGLAQGLVTLAGAGAKNLPQHTDMGIPDRVMSTAAPAMVLVHTIAFRLFDMTVCLWVYGIILVLEAVRIGYSLWMWIKRAIPVIG